jgi:peptidoglycan hydrolase-like protein with peptidoglycan-binding domain
MRNKIVSILEDQYLRSLVLLGTVLVLLGSLALVANASDPSSGSQTSDTSISPGSNSNEGEIDLMGQEPDIDQGATGQQSTSVPPTSLVPIVGDDCTIKLGSNIGIGATGADVSCLQNALVKIGLLSGPVKGSYDPTTRDAVVKFQTDRDLYVDGKVGRETAINLGIWPDEGANIIRTPPPQSGEKDLIGMPLSSVASAGLTAPPVPENSGKGRRIVYDRKGQRVWAIDKKGQIVRSWLVSGSMYSNELPGTHKVYSRSEITTAWNGKATLKKMVRWLKTERGALGFHEIPVRRSDKKVYQTEEELGERLSGGCQRQAKQDADFMWKFATVGTPVVVL